MSNIKTLKLSNDNRILLMVIFFIVVGVILTISYAFFSYSNTSYNNVMGVGYINFNFNDGSNFEKGNIFPIETSDIDNTVTKTFDIASHTSYAKGIKYRVYAVLGDSVSGKTRLLNDVISLEFIPPVDGNGFTTEINNCSTPSSLVFNDGKALISSGTIKNTSNLTTKSYTVKLWIDSNKINISSTTKRANNVEGNPSLADRTSGIVTATRHMRNNSNESSTVNLYPAIASQEGKVIYTTNEFANSYYSFKIIIEAEANEDKPLVYLDPNGGSLNGSNIIRVTTNQNYPNLPTPTRSGYTFLGWSNEKILSKSYWEQGGMVDASGLVNTNIYSTRLRTKDYYKVSPSTHYTITSSDTDITDPIVIRFAYLYTGSKSFIGTNGNINLINAGFTTSSTCSYIKVVAQHRGGSANISVNDLDNINITIFETINNNTIVTETTDHVLKAMWQNNS